MSNEMMCPRCLGEGQAMARTSLGEVILDSDGLAFYKGCGVCSGTGYVPRDYEYVEDDREGEDDYRKEEDKSFIC